MDNIKTHEIFGRIGLRDIRRFFSTEDELNDFTKSICSDTELLSELLISEKPNHYLRIIHHNPGSCNIRMVGNLILYEMRVKRRMGI